MSKEKTLTQEVCKPTGIPILDSFLVKLIVISMWLFLIGFAFDQMIYMYSAVEGVATDLSQTLFAEESVVEKITESLELPELSE